MNKTIKNMLCMLMLLLGSVSIAQAAAEISLSSSAKRLSPGGYFSEPVTITLNLKTDVDLYGLQAEIYVPQGVYVAYNETESYWFNNGKNFPSGMDVYATVNEVNDSVRSYKFFVSARQNAYKPIYAGDNEILTFNIVGNSNLKATDTIKVVNAVATDTEYNDVELADNMLLLRNSEDFPELSLNADPVTIDCNSEVAIPVSLTNPEAVVAGLQFRVTMPAGTALSQRVDKGTRLQNSHVVTVTKAEGDNNDYIVLVQSSTVARIMDVEGTIVTLYATATVPSDEDIVITDPIFSDYYSPAAITLPEEERTIVIPTDFTEATKAKMAADANKDNMISVADVQDVLNNFNSTAEEAPNEDVNGDGMVSVADIQAILNQM